MSTLPVAPLPPLPPLGLAAVCEVELPDWEDVAERPEAAACLAASFGGAPLLLAPLAAAGGAALDDMAGEMIDQTEIAF